VDAEITRIGQLPFIDQAAAWVDLEKTVMTEDYPLIVTSYDGAALPHGARIGGLNIDSIFGMPTWANLHVLQ
jgi:peptide/nickel transport system substrate-binding protein